MLKTRYLYRPDLVLRGFYGVFLRSRRADHLEDNISDIWNYNSVLYIGARVNRMDFAMDFARNGYEIDILEIFGPNVKRLRELDWVNKVVQGDVRSVRDVDGRYDVAFWWHGPEHIHRSGLDFTLDGLKEKVNRLVVCGCPWGEYEQGEAYGNPWETHLSSLDEDDFLSNGFNTATLGRKDVHMNNLLSWYRVS